MSEGRQALNVDSEQPRERLCLGVTELWKLGRDVLHRAVSLAQLHSGQERARSHGSGGSGETIGTQCRCECHRSGSDTLLHRAELGGIPLLELGDALAGKLGNGICTGALCEEPQRRGGHVVVVAVHAEVTGLGQDVCAGGPSASATGGGGGLVLLDGALLDEQVEVTANGGGRQPQASGESGRGERAILGDYPPDPVPGARLENMRRGIGALCTVGDGEVGDKHKNIVT